MDESAAQMLEKLRSSRGWQLLIITTLVLIVPLMVDINGRMSVLRRMHQERSRLISELAELRDEREALKIRLQFVTSAAYLEQWARVEARMTKPGEVALIPLHPDREPQAEHALERYPPSANVLPSISEEWRRIFFDKSANP